MVINTNGKRKTAKARATLQEDGDGQVKINSKPLHVQSKMRRLRVKEPLEIAGDLADEVDIEVTARGGGKQGQTEAIRMAIARALAEYAEGEDLRNQYLDYDRYLLVEDFRRTETRKPSQSSKGARHKQQKSYR
ncbi:MAG: 30S ribosomal protein S9 [Candidatus Nanohaloarchaeota archaeon QJJ-5]|nr:30S ribosomal protein S9 [Candidatus Nanohaloarchaeota archaeon QJJ-5]